MKLSLRYWNHHMGRTIVLLGTIMVSAMAMTIGVLLARSASEESVQRTLNRSGNYDLVAPWIEEGQLHLLDENDGVRQWALILNGGRCRTEYSAELRFGAMDSTEAQEMFHYEPERGRYPQAEGEICGYKSSFDSLGVAAVVGSRFKLALYDTEGNFVWEKEYTIVGVLNDQKDALPGKAGCHQRNGQGKKWERHHQEDSGREPEQGKRRCGCHNHHGMELCVRGGIYAC